jgi:hypothetical protein
MGDEVLGNTPNEPPPYTPGEDAKDFIPPYTPGEDAQDFIPPYTPGEDAKDFPGGSDGSVSGGGILAGLPKAATDFFKSIISDASGKPNPMGIMALATLLSQLGKGGTAPPVGYQGGIPSYTAVRQQIPYAADPNRRPGAGGRQYFTPMKYVTAPDVAQAQTTAASQAQGIAAAAPKYAPPTTGGTVNKEATGGDLMARVRAANPNLDWSKYNPNKMTMDIDPYQEAIEHYRRTGRGVPARVEADLPGYEILDPSKFANRPITTPPESTRLDNMVKEAQKPVPQSAAQGGLMNLARGRYLNGSSDGMADKIPANIEGKQPARLSHGEFVIPADVVSHLGNGNSEAGAERLYSMMDRIRKARTGTTKQGKQINPDKYTPA